MAQEYVTVTPKGGFGEIIPVNASGKYDGYITDIGFGTQILEYTPVTKTISIEEIEESVVLAKNYPWVDGVQDTTQAILNYEASLDVTDLYGSELPKKWDMVHLVWNGVSDRDIKKLSVKAVDRSEVANWWTEFSNGGLLKENIKADTPFSIEMDLLFTEDCIENINLVIFVEPEDTSDVPTITKVSK